MIRRAFLLSLFTLIPSLAFAQDAPLSPSETAKRMTLPEGFQATLFAGEPDVVQPIAMTFDDRGRLWVVENFSYPDWKKGDLDRVIILEDNDGDGQFDKRTVFWEGVNLSGIALGFGGVYLCATPNFVFVPDADGDDRPDGPPVTLLDGFTLDIRHNVFNGLRWGPDGWLWGLHGITATSRVGEPGTPDEERTPINCGVWRYHPTQHKFEVVAWGTTNPFGLDFDDYGEAFITNCVLAHLWHVVPGAHFRRMYGEDFNPFTYQLIESCADHLHWAGGPWQESRTGEAHSDAGGGHAHAGAMIYLGDNWPKQYRNRLFTCNIHGNRVNQDELELHGSGYVAHHAEDLLKVPDSWFRGLELKYGPDGGVYVSDWNDTGECHDYDDVHRETGRIYKVTYGTPKHEPVDLGKLSDKELVELQRHKNDWHVRGARRLLQERAVAGKLGEGSGKALKQMLASESDVRVKLRALWAMYAIDALSEASLLELLKHDDPWLRAWAVRLLVDHADPSAKTVQHLAELAKREPNARVRLALASALQRMNVEARWTLAQRLAEREEDRDDAYLPLMVWYGSEPLVAQDAERALADVGDIEFPLVRAFVARRASELFTSPGATEGLAPLVRTIRKTSDATTQQDLLRGMYAALAGRQNLAMPDNWKAAYQKILASDNGETRELATLIALLLGDPEAVVTLREVVADKNEDPARRERALQNLVQFKAPELLPVVKSALDDPALRPAAIRSLAAYDNEGIPGLLLKLYPTLSPSEKQDALGTLASRPAYATEMLEAIDKGQIPASDLSAFTVRQLEALGQPKITDRIRELWGTTRPTPAAKAEAIARYKQQLTADLLAEADVSHGRAVFRRTCAQCHKLFDDGGAVGPELTGSQRSNLDYLLENLLDPSAAVARDYQMTLLQTDEGRTITGIVRRETEESLTVQTPTETLTVPKSEIEVRQLSPLSMMPEGMLEQLSPADVRALVAYLASPRQAPLPEEAGVKRQAGR